MSADRELAKLTPKQLKQLSNFGDRLSAQDDRTLFTKVVEESLGPKKLTFENHDAVRKAVLDHIDFKPMTRSENMSADNIARIITSMLVCQAAWLHDLWVEGEPKRHPINIPPRTRTF